MQEAKENAETTAINKNTFFQKKAGSGANSPIAVTEFSKNELKQSKTKDPEQASTNQKITYLENQKPQTVYAIAQANSQRAPVTLPQQ